MKLFCDKSKFFSILHIRQTQECLPRFLESWCVFEILGI